MKRNSAKEIAFGGVTAGLAMVIMCFGGMIPVATYVCPLLCMLILFLVLMQCGDRIAWAWYGAVAILSVLAGPDKEAAGVFVALGYYPIVKPKLDKLKLSRVIKLLFFNAVITVLYLILIYVLGLEELLQETEEITAWMYAVLLVLGNLVFILTDQILGKFRLIYENKHGKKK